MTRKNTIKQDRAVIRLVTSDEMTMVIVTRRDLKLTVGKLAAQCGHAVMECALRANKEIPRSLEKYRREGGS